MKKTMMDYIQETPGVLECNFKNYQDIIQPLLEYIQDKKINRIRLVASGSSYNACFIAKNFMEHCLQLEVKILSPFTFTFYENKIEDEDLVIVITQSGYSTNAIQALQKIKSLNKDAICLTGNKESDVKEYATKVFEYGVGEELVGYVTKGVTTLALYLCFLAIEYSGKHEYLKELKKVIDLNKQMIDKSIAFVNEHYKDFSSMHQCYLCGVGPSLSVAMEGALKIGETIHIPSQYYEVEEYIHGPNLQLDPSYTVLFFNNYDETRQRIDQIYKATKKVTNHCFMITNHAIDNHCLGIEETIMPELVSLVYLPFIQVLSSLISSDLKSIYQHPLLKEFKKIADAKTEHFINYDEDQ